MANPQKENGYTAIANEIIENLISYGLTGGELGMCIFVIRKTYGFGKKQDRISLSQFQKALRLTRPGICRIKKRLVNWRLLVYSNNLVKFNKNWESWVVNQRLPSKPAVNRVVNQRLHTKESITKENIISRVAYGKRVPIKGMNRTDPRKFDTDYEPIIDQDGNPLRSSGPKEKPGIAKAMRELLAWAEKKRGRKFTNVPKQYVAMKKMRLAGLKVEAICDRWEEMEGDKFWSEKGFDFTNVANSFDKR